MNTLGHCLLILACFFPQSPPGDEVLVKERLDRVRAVHGGTGPWAVIGYRMGERALKDLSVPRQSFQLKVVHKCPAEVQYSCVADGLQAATGTSPGKLNLKVEEVKLDDLCSIVEDRKTGRKLRFTVKPELAKTITDLPYPKLAEAGERVARLPDDAIFRVDEVK
jgi:formylmethanofuran dehydrogenase subunit E